MQRTYTVEGRWPFPTDMLRRDQATPHAPMDRLMIDRMSGDFCDPELGMTTQKIMLDMEAGEATRGWPRGRNMPDWKRWESFDWIVIDDPDVNLAKRPIIASFSLPDAEPVTPARPPAANELLTALMVARKALSGYERKDTAIELIDNVTAYLGPNGLIHYPESMLGLFAGLLSLVELRYGNQDAQVTALINAARKVLGRPAIPAREGVEA